MSAQNEIVQKQIEARVRDARQALAEAEAMMFCPHKLVIEKLQNTFDPKLKKYCAGCHAWLE